MKQEAKAWIKGALASRGYQLVKASQRIHLSSALQFLVDQGVRPNTVIDVGVASWGTDELYDAFPDADLLLVEPNRDCRDALSRFVMNRGGRGVNVALGAEDEGTVVLSVWSEYPGCSTTMEVNEDRREFDVHQEVRLRSLDGLIKDLVSNDQPGSLGKDLVASRGEWRGGPYVLKVDVQGGEIDVMAGARETLRECTVVVIEVLLYGNPERDAGRVITAMRDYGFVLYDIVGKKHRQLDRSLGCFDAVFVQEHGTLRQDHRWKQD
ncbi:MAG: FkbM family methyltransferase [Planctomycetota bacterium]